MAQVQHGLMTTVGLREFRRNARDLVRRAESGEIVTVTVNGREVAELGPVLRDRWRSWSEVAEVFHTPDDRNWATERELVDQSPVDPFPAW